MQPEYDLMSDVGPKEMVKGKIYKSRLNLYHTYRIDQNELVCVETGARFPSFKGMIFYLAEERPEPPSPVTCRGFRDGSV